MWLGPFFSCIFAACLSLNTCCYTQLDTRNIFQTRLVVRFASVLTVTALGMHRSLRMSLPFLPVGTRAFFFSAHITKYTGTHNKDRTKIRGTTHKVAYSRPRCKIRTGTPKIRIPWCVCVGLLGPLIARAYSSSSERERGTEWTREAPLP